MKTPIITIYVVCILVIGIVLLALYDYNKHGIRTEDPEISKSDADTLKTAKFEGDEHFYKQNYSGAIESYQKAVRMSPRDAHLHNDLGAAYYRLGLESMDTPMTEEQFDFGIEVDARRIDGSEAMKWIEGELEAIESGIITAVINNEADKNDIKSKILSLGHYVHVEQEYIDDDKREYWITIVTGKTKDAFLDAENEYRKAISIKYVKDDDGHRYSNYSAASRNLGTLLFRMGRKSAAVRSWRRAFQLEPTDSELRNLLDKYE